MASVVERRAPPPLLVPPDGRRAAWPAERARGPASVRAAHGEHADGGERAATMPRWRTAGPAEARDGACGGVRRQGQRTRCLARAPPPPRSTLRQRSSSTVSRVHGGRRARALSLSRRRTRGTAARMRRGSGPRPSLPAGGPPGKVREALLRPPSTSSSLNLGWAGAEAAGEQGGRTATRAGWRGRGGPPPPRARASSLPPPQGSLLNAAERPDPATRPGGGESGAAPPCAELGAAGWSGGGGASCRARRGGALCTLCGLAAEA